MANLVLQIRIFIHSNKMQPTGLPWPSLTADARAFVVAALRPCPSERRTAQTALKDNFLLATGSDVADGWRKKRRRSDRGVTRQGGANADMT